MTSYSCIIIRIALKFTRKIIHSDILNFTVVLNLLAYCKTLNFSQGANK